MTDDAACGCEAHSDHSGCNEDCYAYACFRIASYSFDAQQLITYLEQAIYVVDEDEHMGYTLDFVPEIAEAIIKLRRGNEEKKDVLCKRDVGSRPYWMGVDQYDPCPCILIKGHESKCQCTHDIEGV